MNSRPNFRRDHGRSGFAVLSVLFVLIALLILCAPFLMTARNASRASHQLSDRVQSRLALDAGIKHARAQLGGSHPSLDATPYFDDLDELTVESALPPEFWNNHDPKGVMWDVESEDVSGRIDLGSAPPQLFANMVGSVTRLADPLKSKAKEIKVLSTRGFEPEGFLWVGPELVRYAELTDEGFGVLTRGLTANVDQDGNWTGCGPAPALDHAINVAVIDQRAFSIPLWRISDAARGLRSFDSVEQVRDCEPLALAGSLGSDLIKELDRRASVYAGVRGGPEWQRAVRITNSIKAGEGCVVRVSERRNFNPGTTVMITDGRMVEYGLVLALVDADGVKLTQPVRLDYQGYHATMAPLARRPVNVNVASALVLESLFLNLQLNGRSARISRDEAAGLAALCIESRPFTGLEDFLRRVVLPAAGVEPLPKDAPVTPAALANASGALIDVDDGLAVYANALNANDERLAYSTMPLSFVSRDVYRMQARTAVNAVSGVLRSSGVREEVALVIPQRDLLSVFARQEDFEEQLRLTGDAPLFATGPNSTSRFDGPSVPPSRLFAHWGTWKDQPYVPGRTAVAEDEVPIPEHVFASREDAGWCQLAPSRVEETTFLQGRMLHFDHETRDLEGRYLPDEPISYAPLDKKVQWAPAAGGLARALSASFWFKPKAVGDGTFVDFGGGALDTDRVWLGIEGADLVLRVLDGPGDHPATVFPERGEARFEVTPGNGPGLGQDTWSHVEIDVRGNRPDQIHLSVDGRQLGVRTPGLTKLSAGFSTDSLIMVVESDEGFPDRGVARVGNELIEYVKQSKNVFRAQHETTGAHAGFGGRLARERFAIDGTAGVEPGLNQAKGVVNEDHAAGTPVALYGYSMPLASNVPMGEGFLANDLGRFAVGYVAAVEIDSQSHPGEPVSINAIPVPLGLGFEGYNSRLTALQLLPADPAPMTTATLMAAFEKTGGYALVMQLGPATVNNQQEALTLNNSPLWGTEVVHYSGVANDKLLIDRRGALPAENSDTRPHAFIVDWQVTINGSDPDLELDRKVFVVPISINAGASPTTFLPPTNQSEFAQITELATGELTEWVRYDRIEQGHLVRNDPLALAHVRQRIIGDPRGNGQPPVPPPDPGPPDGPVGGPPAPAGAAASAGPLQPLTSPFVAALAAASQQASSPSTWLPYLGTDEDLSAPVTRAARTALQFRGVFGTYSHAHQRNTPVHPVWRVQAGSTEGGEPGHGDAAFVVDALPSDPGWPLVIHRAYRPWQHMETTWIPGSNPMTPTAGAVLNPPAGEGNLVNFVYVAANAAVRAPVAAGTSQTNISPAETRLQARLTLFPSGERPRDVTQVELGRALNGAGVPSAVIDEFVFGSQHFGEGTVHADALQGAQMSLTTDFGVGAQTFSTFPKVVRVARGLQGDPRNFLDDLPKDAGLVRIGNEILCYDFIDSSTGVITIASGGRGLLGTDEGPHEIGEVINWLETRVVTTLAAGMTANSAAIVLEDASDFPSQGTLLIGGELMHYTRVSGTQLEMPSGSSTPGAMDDKGGGLFRGRFGTTPSSHGAGEPVILFPFRYWDRWADRADAPELAYFGLSQHQPNAFWRGVFFQADEPPGTKVEVLQRSNPRMPWDAEPALNPGADLARLQQGLKDGASLSIGVQRDQVEWRAYVRFDQGAFDFNGGLSHGWKRTPRLTLFGVEYLGPGLTLRRVDD